MEQITGGIGIGPYVFLALGVVTSITGISLFFASDRGDLAGFVRFLRGFCLGAALAFFGIAMLQGTQMVPGGGEASALAQYPTLWDTTAKFIRDFPNTYRGTLYYLLPSLAILLLAAPLLCRLLLFPVSLFVRWHNGHPADFLRGFSIVMLVPIAALAIGNYTNFGAWRGGSYLNPYEFYHYYIGTKYAPEVGYGYMYDASLIADEELDKKYSKATLRNLETGHHVNVSKVYERRDEIKGMFSEARWQEFLKDTAYFKRILSTSQWSGILSDKGYNGTPFWTMWVGGLLSEKVDTNNTAGMMMLALLDPLLIAAAVACVFWAFGPRAALLMLVLLGTSYVMRFTHMKGAYLRTDFAMSLVVAACMLKKERFALAGVFMMYAALSRVFPAVFFFGAGAKLAWEVLLHWRPRLREIPGILAAELALVVLAPLVYICGLWVFSETPLALTNALRDSFASLEGIKSMAPYLVVIFAVLQGIACLFFWRNVPQCRPWVHLFAAAISVLFIFSGAVLLDPRIGPLGQKEREERAVAIAANQDHLTYVEDFVNKIGIHLNQVSPWRVGYKYLFINVPSIKDEKNLAQLAAARAALGMEDSPSEPEGAEDASSASSAVSPPSANPEWLERAAKHFVLAQTVVDMRKALEISKMQVDTQLSERALALSSNPFAREKAIVDNLVKNYTPRIVSSVYIAKKYEWRITMLIVLAVCFFLVSGLKPHEALTFSFVPTFFLVSPTYYYYIMLVVPLLFFTASLERPSRLLGAIFMLALAMPGYYLYGDLKLRQEFPTYYWHSVFYLFLVLYMAVLAFGDSSLFWLKKTKAALIVPRVQPRT